MNSGLFEEALSYLHTVIDLEKRDWNRVLPIINSLKCQLEITEIDKADNSVVQLLKILENTTVAAKLNPVFDVCDKEIEELVTKFLEIGSTNSAIMLNRCRVKVISALCNTDAKLQNFGLVGKSMHLIAKEMRKKHFVFLHYQGCRRMFTSAENEAATHSLVMSEILELMNDVTISDTSKQTMEIVWFLQSYGMCCDLLGDYEKSAGLYTQAKEMLEKRFGSEIDCYKSSRHCYNSVVESQTRALQRSKAGFKKFQFDCMVLFLLLVGIVTSHAHTMFDYGKISGIVESETNITQINLLIIKLIIGFRAFLATIFMLFLHLCAVTFFQFLTNYVHNFRIAS